MKKIFKPALAAALLSATAMGHAACYTVYKADGTILLETSDAPVNLTEQIGDTIPVKFGPGATMTMSEHGLYCGSRPGEVGTSNSLADAVRAEEDKAMLLKGAAPQQQPAQVQVQVAGGKTAVEARGGTVLKLKVKEKETQ